MTWAIFNIYSYTILSCLWMARAFGMVFSILLTNLYNISPFKIPATAQLLVTATHRRSLKELAARSWCLQIHANDQRCFTIVYNEKCHPLNQEDDHKRLSSDHHMKKTRIMWTNSVSFLKRAFNSATDDKINNLMSKNREQKTTKNKRIKSYSLIWY